MNDISPIFFVTSEISDSECPWLRCLTKCGTRQNLKNRTLVKYEKENDPDMCKAVNELFADEINAMKAEIADKDSLIADKDSLIADKDSLIADKDAIIAQLQAKLDEYAKMAATQQS